MQIAHVVHALLGTKFFPRMIEIEQHDYARLGIEPGEGDQSDRDGDTHVVTKQPEEPERADERKRNGQQHDEGFRD